MTSFSVRRFLILDSVLGACAVLTTVVLVGLSLFAWIAYPNAGMQGVCAATVAAAVCWLGATLALVVTMHNRGDKKSVNGILLAIFFRTGFPLLAALLLSKSNSWLREGGFFGAIVAFYLLTLTTETILSVRMLSDSRRVSGQG